MKNGTISAEMASEDVHCFFITGINPQFKPLAAHNL